MTKLVVLRLAVAIMIAFVAIGCPTGGISPGTSSNMIADEALRVDPLKPRKDEIESGTDPPLVAASVIQEEIVFAETDGDEINGSDENFPFYTGVNSLSKLPISGTAG